MTTYKTFADALSAAPTTKPALVAANDNKPRKQPEPKYRGTLPALRWLHANHPEAAEAMARAVKSLARTSWSSDASDDTQEIRPTVGELVNAATDRVVVADDGTERRIWYKASIDSHPDEDGGSVVHLGTLRFRRGEMIEFGRTKKGRKLQPRDRLISRDDKVTTPARNTKAYVALRSTTPSPLHAEPLPRNMSGLPALAPMYDPQPGVEANRTTLRGYGVDGSVAFEHLSFPATKCAPGIAKGAEFLSGVVGSSGTSSSGAMAPFDSPEKPKGEAWRIVEEVASGATLKDIGVRLGYGGARPDRVGSVALLDAAKALMAANDNNRENVAA